VVNRGPFVGDKLFVKAYSAADWNNLFTRALADAWNESANCARWRSKMLCRDTNLNMKIGYAIATRMSVVQKHPDGRYQPVVIIHNLGNIPSPSFG